MAKKEKVEKVEVDDVLAAAIARIRKQYGEGAIIQNDEASDHVEAVSTNCFTVDNLLGCGGLPKGRIIEMYGSESSGKSTMCLFFASQVQKQGGTVAYLDVENAYDRGYAEKIGVKTDKLLVSQPSTLEETFDILRAYAETNAVDLIIVDSVAAMTPKSELEGEEMLKDTMAVQARLMGKALRIVTGPISRSKTVVIFINQLREKIGVFYGEKTTTPGGKALKFYASVRLSVTKGEKLYNDKKEQIGNVLKLTAVKNKVGAPYRTGEVTLYYGTGIDLAVDTFKAAVEREIITKTGNTYSIGDKKLGVGEGASVEFLKQNPDIYDEVYKTLSATK